MYITFVLIKRTRQFTNPCVHACRYLQMEQQGHFDAILDTSSQKLAVAALLHAVGVDSNTQEDA